MKEETVQATAAAHLRSVPDPPEELENLFREHHAQIFRTAYRITGSSSDAEDVLQTIFLRLMRSGDQRTFTTGAGSYFHRAAINASLDLMRKQSRTKSVSLDGMEAELTEASDRNPEAQHADRELRKIIQQAIARLGSRAAEVFVLRYLEGYENREIAHLLGTSQMVIAVTLHRARTRLRKEIGEFLEKHHEA